MSETKSTLKPWTDAEKLGILFQVIEKAGSIPWDELQLPDGRTKRAAQLMIDREKTKAKKALTAEANNESPPETHTKGSKRKGKSLKDAEGGGDDGSASQGSKKQKKPRASRKKATATAAAKTGEDDEEEKGNGEAGEDGTNLATIPVKPSVDMEDGEEGN